MTWLRQLVEAEGDQDPTEFLESLKVDLFEDEVFVFTPKGEVKNLSAGSTPLDFAYAVHTDVGHRCVGAKVNGKIVPLHYQLQLGRHRRDPDRKAGARALARLAEARAHQPRPQQDPRLLQARAPRGRRAPRPRGAPGRAAEARPAAAADRRLAAARRRDPRDGLPQGRRLLHRARPGQDLAEDRRQQADAAPEGRARRSPATRPSPARRRARGPRRAPRRTQDASNYGIKVKGVDDVAVRLAKCCRPVPGDEIVGYVSLGRGITIHREDCQQRDGAAQGARALHRGRSGRATTRPPTGSSSQVDAWDRTRLLEDLSRTFSEAGVNILEATCIDQAPDGQEPLRGRGRGHRAAASQCIAPPAQRRLGLRRLPDHAGRAAGPAKARADRRADRSRPRLARPRRYSYFRRGQKKPRSPSLRLRGTTWTWKWGTLLADDVVGGHESARGVRRLAHGDGEQAGVRRSSGSIRSSGRSQIVSWCSRGTSRVWPGKSGRLSRKASERSSSKTTWASAARRRRSRRRRSRYARRQRPSGRSGDDGQRARARCPARARRGRRCSRRRPGPGRAGPPLVVAWRSTRCGPR